MYNCRRAKTKEKFDGAPSFAVWENVPGQWVVPRHGAGASRRLESSRHTYISVPRASSCKCACRCAKRALFQGENSPVSLRFRTTTLESRCIGKAIDATHLYQLSYSPILNDSCRLYTTKTRHRRPPGKSKCVRSMLRVFSRRARAWAPPPRAGARVTRRRADDRRDERRARVRVASPHPRVVVVVVVVVVRRIRRNRRTTGAKSCETRGPTRAMRCGT